MLGWGGVMWDMGCYGTRWGKSGQGWYLNIARSLQAAVFVMKIAISPSYTLSWKASKNMVLHSMKGIQIFLSHNAPPHVRNRYVFLSFEFLIFWIGLRKSVLLSSLKLRQKQTVPNYPTTKIRDFSVGQYGTNLSHNAPLISKPP